MIWLALAPPLFTGGACTAEFDREAAQLVASQSSVSSPLRAQAYWGSRQIASSLISADQCRHFKPRYIDACASGAIVYAVVPVQNLICRVYRDDGIRVQLLYDERDRLARIMTDMNSFKSLPLPFVGVTLHWGR
jgi:hypothetical protein